MRTAATAKKIPERAAQVYQEIVVVLHVAEGRATVRSGDVEYSAKRAASCLLEPREGDRALCAVAEKNAWILAVLDRNDTKNEDKTTIAVDGDLEIVSRSGRVRMGGAEGVSIASEADVTIAAGEFNVRAMAASLVADGIEVLGKTVRAEAGKVRVLAEALDSVLDRFSQRVKRSYRFVEERDSLRAGTIDYVADKAVNVSGENAVVTAKELVKVDGGQIQLG